MVRRDLARAPLLCLAFFAVPACHSGGAARDGASDAAPFDASSGDVATALGLDFVATGCARGDAGAATCAGAAPLALGFSPVGSATLTRYRWTFGDGTASTDRAPIHTYVLPGTYDVAVAAEGPGGSVSRQRPGFVTVAPNAAGVPCDIDGQCATGLFCLCGEGAPCLDGFTRGLCTRACSAVACDPSATCARLTVPAPAPTGSDAGALDAPVIFDAGNDGPVVFDAAGDGALTADGGALADARDAGASDAAKNTSADGGLAGAASSLLCFSACTQDADCAAGLACRTLPGQAPGSWVGVCVPSYLRSVGDPCRDARGQLDDHVCATGSCADVGAIGLCSATCAHGEACPTGASCATFGDGRALCLAACTSSSSCTSDPLLACEQPKGSGALGFTIAPAAPAAAFCAPRSCSSQADCAPSGTCKPLGVGAHCVAN